MIRVSVSLFPEHADYDDIRRAAVRAEELGVDALYTWDHFFPLYGDPGGKHFECWTLLAALAEVTHRVPTEHKRRFRAGTFARQGSAGRYGR